MQAAQQFSPYNYHGSSMDEITRNHPHNNIIMMLDGGGGSTAGGQQSNGGGANLNINGSILNSNTKNRDHYLQGKV
jgi:hypothetical protein